MPPKPEKKAKVSNRTTNNRAAAPITVRETIQASKGAFAPASRASRKTGESQAPEPTPKIYVDSLAASLHESMADLALLGHLSPHDLAEAETVLLKPNTPPTGAEIRALRKREGATQSVFAHYLGVSVNTVSQWERGERTATGTSAKLLSLVERHGLTYIR